MKKLLFILSFACSSIILGQSFNVNGINYNVIDAKSCEVGVNKDFVGKASIPRSVSNGGIKYSVTDIGEDAFVECTSLTSITIRNSVTNIRAKAFGFCTSLTSITLPSSVTFIGVRAFEGCSSLTSIILPNSVTSVGEGAFDSCPNLNIIRQ